MLELGKIYNWKVIEETYPDMWVLLTDWKKKNGWYSSVRLLAVAKNCDGLVAYAKMYEGKKQIAFERTTFSMPNMGVLM